jgi:hypothetical protein
MENGAGDSGGSTDYGTPQWRLRDTLAAALLFLGSAAFVLWQNTRVAVLWDLGYLLDTSWRIALGQTPYRDFPLVHAPVTFLIQAGLIKLFGRHYMVPVVYAAVASGLGTVMAWRIVLRVVLRMERGAWGTSLLLAAPLAVVGVYAIYPHPIYDGDCALAILLALLLLMRAGDARGWARPFAAGAACVLPLFCKQNMGLPFLAVVAAGILLLLLSEWLRVRSVRLIVASALAFALAGIAVMLAIALVTIASTAVLHNYMHWTVNFAAQRRMPGLGSMLAVYAQPSFVWTVPVLAVGLALCWTRVVQRTWGRFGVIALISAPFAWSLMYLLLQDDADERADNLLALWPLWMAAALVFALLQLWRVIAKGDHALSIRTLMPFFVLAAIHGTFLSQQLWGSTYALWPLLLVLIAGVLAELPRPARPVALATAAVVCVTFNVCGELYAASLERLNYTDIPDGRLQHAETPALRGMATPGPYLANLDELAAFSDREIPRGDALLLLPGEDPFYYATGRVPQFPVTLFDPATDPYSAAQLVDEARRRGVRWVIVKRVLQSKANFMPEPGPTMRLLSEEFALDRELSGYDVYRRR